MEDRIAEFEMHAFDLGGGAVLERGCVYLVRLAESLALPRDLRAACNAKSSTGRLDVLTRVIADDGTEFDRVPPGYEGPLWAEICPRSFAVLVEPGLSLAQIRFFSGAGEPRLDDVALERLHAREPLVDGAATIQDGLGFSVDLTPGEDGLVGWRARPHSDLVDMRRIGAHAPAAFWDPLRVRRGEALILDPGAFYILVSREAVHIPPGYAAEMAPFLAMVGEFRVHYAGFFDPGFGHGPAGGRRRAGGAGGPLPRGAVRARARPERRPARLRGDDRAAGDPLRRRARLELPGPGPQALQALRPARRRLEDRVDLHRTGQPVQAADILQQELVPSEVEDRVAVLDPAEPVQHLPDVVIGGRACDRAGRGRRARACRAACRSP